MKWPLAAVVCATQLVAVMGNGDAGPPSPAPAPSVPESGSRGRRPPPQPDLFLESGLAADSPCRGKCAQIAARVLPAKKQRTGALQIEYPFHETLFPPGIVAPEIRWKDDTPGVAAWLLRFAVHGIERRIFVVTESRTWKPPPDTWKAMQRLSRERPARLSILGLDRSLERARSRGDIAMSTSKDPVGAPVFYREVPLPFSSAFRNVHRIRWRLGDLSSDEPPRVVLDGMPVCGNCHSFSADGAVLGIDVDHANDRGAYVIAPVERETTFSPERLISWTDFGGQEGRRTLGILARMSPDGKHVVSTVKDRSVLLPQDDLSCSLVFLPIQGVLAVYSRETASFRALAGADDPRFVHTSPCWSPDKKWIVFSRAPAERPEGIHRKRDAVLSPRECRKFLERRGDLRYDLHRIPFNDGEGGRAAPLEGASANGKSNYFPRFSPDGRWIVFCQANRFLFIQPDSELYLIPSGGGEARRLRCNLPGMNSWHSWSPNGRWLVFSSKANGPYTQLWLTHIDPHGNAGPALVLAHLSSDRRAANLPEFVNIPSSHLQRILYRLGPR